MTSFSVKKPFTVFVAVVAILVFGVMSYVKMTPDLMPNMDYPYVGVVTTYPGAAPEEVEAVVTKPMEQSMATLNDIKTVTSTSAENYSMLVLEFEQDTNMDSAVVDILQKTQLLTGRWDESIGTPRTSAPGISACAAESLPAFPVTKISFFMASLFRIRMDIQ